MQNAPVNNQSEAQANEQSHVPVPNGVEPVTKIF
jgi:hypothetical protein